jgi:hypothetical protein
VLLKLHNDCRFGFDTFFDSTSFVIGTGTGRDGKGVCGTSLCGIFVHDRTGTGRDGKGVVAAAQARSYDRLEHFRSTIPP